MQSTTNFNQIKLNDSTDLREDVNVKLQKGIVHVTFAKVDGSIRVLDCTLNGDLIPEDKAPKTQVAYNKDAAPSPTAKVFVQSLQEWRSFRWDSIISYH